MTTINALLSSSVTHFEDLANEIIYEIFDFLDVYHVCEAFFDFNIRFQNLVHCSSLPLNINMSFLSKSNFQRYYTQFVLPNIDRINSLRLSNSSMFDLVFPSRENVEKFIGLKSVVLDNMISQDLLHHLSSLPNLSSLIINQSDGVPARSINFHPIICLPALKYCKVSCRQIISLGSLDNIRNESSSLEHLVINNAYNLYKLPKLLSRFPHLHHLSIKHLYMSDGRRINALPEMLNKLTHVTLTIKHVKFNRFEPFLVSLCHHLQVLRISTSDDTEYLKANRWERLISTYMADLRIFDIQHSYSINDDFDSQGYDLLTIQFTSSFWVKRQWYFQRQYSEETNPKYGMFYSIQPYRRRDYILYGKHHQTRPIVSNYHLVRHVHIQTRSAIRDSSIFFPNANELTISFDYCESRYSRTSILGRSVPLEGIHKITIDSDRFHFVTFFQILYYTLNCSQLILNSLVLENADPSAIRRNATFRLVSNSNKITDITIKSMCTLEQIKLLVELCPRVQHLTINVLEKDFTSIIKHLFSKSNKHTRHLTSLYIRSTGDIYIEKLMNLLEPIKQSDEFTVQEIDYKDCHIWW